VMQSLLSEVGGKAGEGECVAEVLGLFGPRDVLPANAHPVHIPPVSEFAIIIFCHEPLTQVSREA
jgi:hypothetical protein